MDSHHATFISNKYGLNVVEKHESFETKITEMKKYFHLVLLNKMKYVTKHFMYRVYCCITSTPGMHCYILEHKFTKCITSISTAAVSPDVAHHFSE